MNLDEKLTPIKLHCPPWTCAPQTSSYILDWSVSFTWHPSHLSSFSSFSPVTYHVTQTQLLHLFGNSWDLRIWTLCWFKGVNVCVPSKEIRGHVNLSLVWNEMSTSAGQWPLTKVKAPGVAVASHYPASSLLSSCSCGLLAIFHSALSPSEPSSKAAAIAASEPAPSEEHR